MRMLAMMAVVAGACLLGCERQDATKGMDPAIDGVSKNEAPPANLSILEDPKKLNDARSSGGASGSVAVAPAPATSAPTTTATAPATQAETAPATGPATQEGTEITPPPPPGG